MNTKLLGTVSVFNQVSELPAQAGYDGAVYTPNGSDATLTTTRAVAHTSTSKKAALYKLNTQPRVQIPAAVKQPVRTLSNRVATEDLPSAFREMPFLYGSFNIQGDLENFPSAALTILNIHPSELADYKTYYCTLNKEFVFYDIPFLVYSFNESHTVQLIEGVSYPSYTLSITFRSKWELLGSRSIFLNRVNNSIETYLRQKVSMTELADALNVRYQGEQLNVPIPTADELTNDVLVTFNGAFQSNIRLIECYADYTRSDAIHARKLDYGASHQIEAGDINYSFALNQNLPFLFRRASLGDLYETFEAGDISLELSRPLYVRDTLPTVETVSVELAAEEMNFNFPHPYVTGEGSAPTQTIRQSTFRDGVPVSEQVTVLSYLYLMEGAASWNAWRPLSSTTTQYVYTPLNISFNSPYQIKNRKGEIVDVSILDSVLIELDANSNRDFTGTYTLLSTAQRFPIRNLDLKILSGIITSTSTLIRFMSETESPERDSRTIRALIEEQQGLITPLLSLKPTPERDDKLSELYATRTMLRRKIAAMQYYPFHFSSGGQFVSELYPDPRPEETIPVNIIRVKPGLLDPENASRYAVDSDGYAYVGFLNPAWTPPMYIKAESRTSGLVAWYSPHPENVLVQYRKSERIQYLQSLIASYNEERQNAESEEQEQEIDAEIEQYRKEIAEIRAEQYRQPLISGSKTNSTIMRKIINRQFLKTDPQTGTKEAETLEMYEEYSRDVTYRGPNVSTASTNTQYSVQQGRPPAPTFLRPNYVLLNSALQLPRKYRYIVASSDLHKFQYLGDVAKTMQDGETLGTFPTTSFARTQKALEADLSIRHWQSFCTFGLSLFGLHSNIRPGDYLNPTDIPELRNSDDKVGVPRALGFSFQLQFNGLDPDGNIAVTCDQTQITAGYYVKRTIKVIDKIEVPIKEGVTNEDIVLNKPYSVYYDPVLYRSQV